MSIKWFWSVLFSFAKQENLCHNKNKLIFQRLFSPQRTCDSLKTIDITGFLKSSYNGVRTILNVHNDTEHSYVKGVV